MLYKYIASTPEGERQTGSIDAASMEIAVSSLQRRNLIVVSISPTEKAGSIFEMRIKWFDRIKPRDMVILSRQLSTLFEAKIPTLESFRLLASETESPVLARILGEITEDIQSGISISQALGKHPDAFSKFYVSMIRAGEESGKLDESFSYLADYMERMHDMTSKVKGALTYPAFVIAAFAIVLILMMVVVVPKLTAILVEAGQEIPSYTRVVIGISNFFRTFGIFLLFGLIGGIVFLFRYLKTKTGKMAFSRFQLTIPIVGPLYKKFYLSRMTDNLNTLFSGGISAVSALEFTADIVGNSVYEEILLESAKSVQGGSSMSDIFSKYTNIPPLVSQMLRIGEQSGKLSFILGTLARFYRKEVDTAVETMISMIEPMLIMVLGLTVAILFMAVLAPIYNISASI